MDAGSCRLMTTNDEHYPMSSRSGVANERKINEKLRGGVQAVGTIRLGVRMDIMAARTSGDRYNT